MICSWEEYAAQDRKNVLQFGTYVKVSGVEFNKTTADIALKRLAESLAEGAYIQGCDPTSMFDEKVLVIPPSNDDPLTGAWASLGVKGWFKLDPTPEKYMAYAAYMLKQLKVQNDQLQSERDYLYKMCVDGGLINEDEED